MGRSRPQTDGAGRFRLSRPVPVQIRQNVASPPESRHSTDRRVARVSVSSIVRAAGEMSSTAFHYLGADRERISRPRPSFGLGGLAERARSNRSRLPIVLTRC